MAKVKLPIEFGVYQISFENKILYIGSSADMKKRWKQHIKQLEKGTHIKSLQKFVDENITNLEELEFKIIHKTKSDDKIRLFYAELILIMYYKPLNKAVLQFGLKYISFGSVDWDLKILEYI